MSARSRLMAATAAAAVALVSGVVVLPGRDSGARVVAGVGTPVSTVRVPSAGRRLSLPAPRETVILGTGAIAVPPSFLGVSTEYWGLPLFERHLALFERVLSLIHVPGDGPFVLRIGGDSADRSFWDPGAVRGARWIFHLTPAWLRPTGALVRDTGVKLIVDLNLVTGSPLSSAEWARAALATLPSGSVVGFEIGNEPDIYSRTYWLARRVGAGFLPAELSSASYVQDYAAYAHLLAQVAPRVPLLGPALANPGLNVGWISGLLAAAHPGLGVVSAHRYPYSACVKPGAAAYPTIARLLSEKATAGLARTVSTGVGLAHRAGLPFRLTELNSVTCGGVAGISNTFATALWAPDALFELLQAGVDGVSVHVRAHAVNAAFVLSGNGLYARPLLYGLILFARTLGGPGAQLVPVRVQAARTAVLKTWAVRVAGGGLHVLLINKGYRPLRVALRVPATGPATVQRLLAPAAKSRSGVTLNGQQLGSDGSWRGRGVTQTIMPDIHGYELTIPRVSAALVSLDLGRVVAADRAGFRSR